MRWAGSSSSSLSSWGVAEMAVLASLLLQPSSAMLTCNNILADGAKFDLSGLKGPHSVVTTEMTGATQRNTTFTIDLCESLKRKGKVEKAKKCPEGTRLCGITQLRLRNDPESKPAIDEAIPIWGAAIGGAPQDHTAERLKPADSTLGGDGDGVRLTLEGAKYGKVRQKAVIEMVCTQSKTGTEGEWPAEVEYESSAAAATTSMMNNMVEARDDKPEGGDGDGDGDGGSSGAKQLVKDKEEPALVWKSYGMEGDTKVLRLTWHSKHACATNANGGQTSQHWGFFTWFVVLVFLATAAYLIFGSWLNYNRYGARGWDLLPHGDTIRDVPYLMKDWLRRLINTVQGSGSRGGYSAV